MTGSLVDESPALLGEAICRDILMTKEYVTTGTGSVTPCDRGIAGFPVYIGGSLLFLLSIYQDSDYNKIRITGIDYL
jgi:hypothetical protein